MVIEVTDESELDDDDLTSLNSDTTSKDGGVNVLALANTNRPDEMFYS